MKTFSGRLCISSLMSSSGDGWTVAPEPDHQCATDCPVQVQVRCETCEGAGKVLEGSHDGQ